MEITTSLLCDHVQVRDGLLFVLSGGITRIRRASYPAQLGVGFALVLELERIEAERSHGFALVIIGEDGEEVGRVAADIQVNDSTGTYAGEHIQVPLAIDMHGAVLPKPGAYELHIYVDGELRRTVQFWAEETREGPV
ncbi:MAG: hypothetical protein WD271_05360 [Acidimicrobiia bacterium]